MVLELKRFRIPLRMFSNESLDLIKQSVKALDKAAQKGVIKKGTAARKKSRLMKKLNKSQA